MAELNRIEASPSVLICTPLRWGSIHVRMCLLVTHWAVAYVIPLALAGRQCRGCEGDRRQFTASGEPFSTKFCLLASYREPVSARFVVTVVSTGDAPQLNVGPLNSPTFRSPVEPASRSLRAWLRKCRAVCWSGAASAARQILSSWPRSTSGRMCSGSPPNPAAAARLP
jgi:hypothetical protein